MGDCKVDLNVNALFRHVDQCVAGWCNIGTFLWTVLSWRAQQTCQLEGLLYAFQPFINTSQIQRFITGNTSHDHTFSALLTRYKFNVLLTRYKPINTLQARRQFMLIARVTQLLSHVEYKTSITLTNIALNHPRSQHV